MKQKKIKIDDEEIVIHYPEALEGDVENQESEILGEECYRDGRRKKDAVYVDLGANIGMASLYFRKWAKKIYAFEPNPTIFEALKKNTEKYDNIEIFNLGAGPTTGIEYFYSHNNSDLPQTIQGGQNSLNATKVNFIRLDEFFEQHKIDHVDVMKVDIEESEYFLFPSESFANVAEKIDFMIMEAHFQTGGGFPDAIPIILKETGFKTKKVVTKTPGYQNVFRAYTYTDYSVGVSKEYKVGYHTLFTAERKK